jgi:adenine deaminase
MSDIREFIRAASGGESKATVAVRGGRLVNVVSEEIYQADVAIYRDRIIAVGDISEYIGPETEIIDATGKYLAPGMIDGHLHVECSKLSLTSFAKAVVPLGTTSIVTGLDQIAQGILGRAVQDALHHAALHRRPLFQPSGSPRHPPLAGMRRHLGDGARIHPGGG